MSSPRKLAGDVATAAVGIRLARTLYGAWRRMQAEERQRLAAIAERVKENALDLRGASDPEQARRDLHAANEELAEAMIESASADPETDATEVQRLREDLRRELDRISTADISAARLDGSREPRG